MRRAFAFMLALLATTASLAAAGAVPDNPGNGSEKISIKLSPMSVEAGLGFDGARVVAEGEAPEGCQVFLAVLGEKGKMAFSARRKAWAFWIAGERVLFENAPALYIFLSSAPLGDALPEAKARELGLGKEGIVALIASSDGAGQVLGARELVRLQRKLGLYQTEGGGVAIGAGERWAATIQLPGRAPMGTYNVQAIAVRGRAVVAIARATFEIKPSRSVAFINGFARAHGFLYGILCVLLAVLVGLGIGALFGRHRK